MFKSSDQWAAVAAFYTSYHYLRAALIADPVFQDQKALSLIHPALKVGDQFEKKHSFGGLSKAQLGLIEMCIVVYPHVSRYYTLGHQASCGVRYDGGFPRHVSLEKSMEYAEIFRQEYLAGNLVHTKSKALKAAQS
ncbi:hypothetical protein [Glutamicibacter sp.]|uniref:hypothetical protein n=1 Tax=Glutamicibacter sp. TaxID=1931995 RepID=UPI0028BEA415|nr:hypothetical protein [Glutamicibacter sp.]